MLTFVVLYAWAGGAQDHRKANRSNDLIDIAFREIAAQPDGPHFIVGDFNADVAHLPALGAMLQSTDDEEHNLWFDIGGNADIWGGIPAEPTCKAPNTTTATRRDYVIANRLAC